MTLQRKPLPEPTFHPIYGRLFYGLLLSKGLDVETLLRLAGITPAQLASEARGIAASRMGNLIREARKRCDDPYLAYEWARSARSHAHGIHGIAIASSRNVREALETLSEIVRLRGNVFDLHFAADEAKPCFVATPRFELGDLHDFMYATFGVLIVQIIEEVVGKASSRLILELPLREPGWEDGGARFFPCKLVFDAPRFALHIPADLMDQPCVTADARVREAALRQCRFEAETPAGDLAGRVSDLLAPQQGSYPTLPEVARYLGLSSRSLSRTLQREGATYQALLDDARKAQALRHLADPGWTVEQIAVRLGYTEPSTLIRAFRRWYGCTPQQYRHRSGAAALVAGITS